MEMEHLTDSVASSSKQYLTFEMNKEYYGIDIMHVIEIRQWESPTTLPTAPDYIKGVINLRGSIVPIIDLRTIFSLPDAEYTPLTVIIMVHIKIGDSEEVIGLIIDAVSDVLRIPSDELQKPPSNAANDMSRHISGMYNKEGSVVAIIEIDSVFSEEFAIADEIQEISQA